MTSSEYLFDEAAAQAFADRIVNVLNDGALCLMISIGHRTGLYDAMREMAPATSEQIASATGLNECYVREWLGAMVTSRIANYDAITKAYSIPAEHSAFLTRAAAADNLAVFAQYIGQLGGVETDIVACFRHGGGVPYSRYDRFHEIMAEDSGQSVMSSLESHILPLVPGLTDRLESGIRMLDLGCGRGRIIRRLAERYPNSYFTGIDFSEEAIEFARSETTGLDNIEYRVQDLSDFDERAEPESFDFVTPFDAVHDQAKPLNLLKGIYRALKPDGAYLMQDISGTSHVDKDIEHPLGTLLYTISCMHCMTVSLAQGGEGLGAMWGEAQTHDYLKRAGFQSVTTNKLEHDIQNNWYVVRKVA